MDSTILLQAFVFLLAAIVAVPIAKRLGLGSVLGYLVAGAIIGPFGLKLFGDPESAMHAAEFGVVIMLFLIGLELQPSLLWRMRTAIVGMGGAQVLVSGLALTGVGLAFGVEWRMSLAVGFILALSSTAIVMQSLRERGIADTAAGRGSFAVLLFQDIAIIPMLALFPLLATGAVAAAPEHGMLAGAPAWVKTLATVAAVGAVVLAGRFVMRPIFRIVARTRMQELFTATALLIVVGVTLLMETVSLSPALGAFIAGVVLADSEFRHEIQSDIEPFRGLLLGLFFVSVGATIDFELLFAQPVLIIGLALLLILVKAAVMFGLARAFHKSRADAAVIALALAQGGEFAFVLFAFALGAGVLPAEIVTPLTAVVALSMAATPLLFILGERLAGKLVLPDAADTRGDEVESNSPNVIIAGYGRVGQTVGRLLDANGFRVSVLEHDAEQVDALRSFGRAVNYGDATRVDLLRAAGAEDASVLVIAIDNKDKSLELVDTVHRHFPHMKVIARAFDRRHAYELMQKNVDGLERETFESSVRLGVKALGMLGQTSFRAERAGRVFRSYDEKALSEMGKLWGGDEAAFRTVVRDRMALFEELMRVDIAAMEAEAGERDEAVEDYIREARESATADENKLFPS